MVAGLAFAIAYNIIRSDPHPSNYIFIIFHSMKYLSFRFFFIYFVLGIGPWTWFFYLPGLSQLFNLYTGLEEPVVRFVNAHLLHVKTELNTEGGGSGDTSYAWAQFYTFLLAAALGALIWTWIDRKRLEPRKGLHIFLWTILRYYVATVAFGYGILKLFALQMPFPNLSMMATPLGDFLPMRLSWMFMGYSTPYQVFSGAAEVIAGLLLIYRPTATLGALAAFAVFTNVFVMNLSYDIPVKLFSMQMVICCLGILAYDWRRLWNFFFANKAVDHGLQYAFVPTKKWQRITGIVLKLVFIAMILGMPLFQSISRYREIAASRQTRGPIEPGLYHITTFKRNNVAEPIANHDAMSWKDFIFDLEGAGSINTEDTLFRQRYHRGHFMYQPDSTRQTIDFQFSKTDPRPLFYLNYKKLDDRNLQLWGKVRQDSVFYELARSEKAYQLAERQFHWISEANR